MVLEGELFPLFPLCLNRSWDKTKYRIHAGFVRPLWQATGINSDTIGNAVPVLHKWVDFSIVIGAPYPNEWGVISP